MQSVVIGSWSLSYRRVASVYVSPTRPWSPPGNAQLYSNSGGCLTRGIGDIKLGVICLLMDPQSVAAGNVGHRGRVQRESYRPEDRTLRTFKIQRLRIGCHALDAYSLRPVWEKWSKLPKCCTLILCRTWPQAYWGGWFGLLYWRQLTCLRGRGFQTAYCQQLARCC